MSASHLDQDPTDGVPSDCLFCRIVSRAAPSREILRDDLAVAFLDVNPAAEYHTLVVSRRHYTNILDTPETDLLGVVSMVHHLARLYRNTLGIENLQVLTNAGEAAQQSARHLHFHLVPRYEGDGQDLSWRIRSLTDGDLDRCLRRVRRAIEDSG